MPKSNLKWYYSKKHFVLRFDNYFKLQKDYRRLIERKKSSTQKALYMWYIFYTQ